MLRGLTWDVGLPLAAYYGLHAAGTADWPALLAATGVAGLRIVWVAVRDRRLNAFATLMLVVFGIGLVLSSVSGDARLLLLKDSVTTAVVGLTFLVTSLRGTPLTVAAAQGFRPADRERIAEEYRTVPLARHLYRVSAADQRDGRAEHTMMIATFGALIVWNGWYVRRTTAGAVRSAGAVTPLQPSPLPNR
jgi:hypothetical protein